MWKRWKDYGIEKVIITRDQEWKEISDKDKIMESTVKENDEAKENINKKWEIS